MRTEELKQAYDTVMEKPLQILEIFNDFFGEDRVDMQGFPTLEDLSSALPPSFRSNQTLINAIRTYTANYSSNKFILVHFPHVRVTNEFDRSTDIYHLYAKVDIDLEGKILGRFSLNRSEYTVLHFSNNYMHSHVGSIPTYDFTEFQVPCTGNGPINHTIGSLLAGFNEDLWRLFCLELDRFVQVESIAGTPYHRLESLISGGVRHSIVVYDQITFHNAFPNQLTGAAWPALLAEFTKYVIDSGVLKFSYVNGSYTISLSPTDYYIKISNLFISWYNTKARRGEVSYSLQELRSYNIVGDYKYVNNTIRHELTRGLDYHNYIGAYICTFKGERVDLVISDVEADSRDLNSIILLNKEICDYIITKILNVINYKYGNTEEENTGADQEIIFL